MEENNNLNVQNENENKNYSILEAAKKRKHENKEKKVKKPININLIKVLLIIGAFFLGVILTVVVFKLIPQKTITNQNVLNDTSKTVKVTEADSLTSSINKIYNAVVLVETYSNGEVASTGTGFVYKIDDKYGYIITNNHVVNGGEKYNITYIDGTSIEGTLVGTDEYTDVAVLKVDQASVLQVATLGASDKSSIGDTVFTVGSPMGSTYMGTVTKGILSGKDRVVEVSLASGGYYMEVLQTDAAINPGNSGGPLVNINGEVIGVNSMKLVEDEIEGMGFSIPIETVMDTVSYLEAGKIIERPVLGVKVVDVTNKLELYFRYNIKVPSDVTEGVYVYEVQSDSSASKAGVKSGDIIVEMDGKKVTSSSYFKYLLYKHDIKKDMKVSVYRDGSIVDLTIKLN